VGGACQVATLSQIWMMNRPGYTLILLRYSLLTKLTSVVLLVIGSVGGALGVAFSYSLAGAISLLSPIFWRKTLGADLLRSVYGVTVRAIVSVFVTGLIAKYIAQHLYQNSPMMNVALSFGIMLSILSIFSLTFKPIRNDLEPIGNALLSLLDGRKSRR